MHMRVISAAAPRAFALELGKHNIAVNAVTPDMTPSETEVAPRRTAAPPRARPVARPRPGSGGSGRHGDVPVGRRQATSSPARPSMSTAARRCI